MSPRLVGSWMPLPFGGGEGLLLLSGSDGAVTIPQESAVVKELAVAIGAVSLVMVVWELVGVVVVFCFFACGSPPFSNPSHHVRLPPLVISIVRWRRNSVR